MKLWVKRCRTCGALGVGPKPTKLYPLDDLLYCKEDFKDALEWHESRGQVVSGVKSIKEFHEDVLRPPKKLKVGSRSIWRGYIEEVADMAGWALEVGDRRVFVHYFARAMYAWALKEEQ